MLHQALRLLLTFQMGMTQPHEETQIKHTGLLSFVVPTQKVCPTQVVLKHTKLNQHTEMKFTLRYTSFPSVRKHTSFLSVAHFNSHTPQSTLNLRCALTLLFTLLHTLSITKNPFCTTSIVPDSVGPTPIVSEALTTFPADAAVHCTPLQSRANVYWPME